MKHFNQIKLFYYYYYYCKEKALDILFSHYFDVFMAAPQLINKAIFNNF